MNIDEFYGKMRREVAGHAIGRGESAAFLIWFLENYFRLDHDEAIGSVCDQTNDKGIDAIWVDNEDETIYLFQSKFSPLNNQEQGDNDLRNFVGARQWFSSEQSISQLINSTASKELKALIKECKIPDKINFKKVCVFITNKKFNEHANEYFAVTENFEAYDCNFLFEKFTYFADQEVTFSPIDLRLRILQN